MYIKYIKTALTKKKYTLKYIQVSYTVAFKCLNIHWKIEDMVNTAVLFSKDTKYSKATKQ